MMAVQIFLHGKSGSNEGILFPDEWPWDVKDGDPYEEEPAEDDLALWSFSVSPFIRPESLRV